MESLKNKCYGHTSELAKELMSSESCITEMLKEMNTLKEVQKADKQQIEEDYLLLKGEIESSSELISRQETKILDLENDNNRLKMDLMEVRKKLAEANKAQDSLTTEFKKERDAHQDLQKRTKKVQREVDSV